MGDTKKARKKYPGEERWLRDLNDIRHVTSRPCGDETRIGPAVVGFNEAMVTELLRRREVGTENDGLRSTSYDQGGGGGSGESTPTEAAALRGLPGADEALTDDWRYHEQPDPIQGLCDEALAAFSEMARCGRLFSRKLSLILNAGASIKGRSNQVPICEVCDRPIDKPGAVHHRGRYCDTCNKAWQRDGRPHDLEEAQWAQHRRTELEAAGNLFNQIERRTGYAVEELDALVAAGVLPDQKGA